MSSNRPPRRSPHPVWYRLVVGGLLALPLLFALVLVLIVAWRWSLKRDVDRQLAALRARGIPLSGAELNDFYTAVPPDRNAALVMTQAFELLQEFGDDRDGTVSSWKLPERGESLSAEDVRLLEDYLALNADARAKAREAVQLPDCRYPVDFEPGLDALLPHLSPLKNLGRCESMSAALRVKAGHLDEASEDIRMMLALAATLDTEPCLISQLINMALLRMAGSTLEHVLNAGTLDVATLNDLDAAFESAARTNRLSLGFTGEIAMMTPMFRMNWAEIEKVADAGDSDPLVSSSLTGLLRFSGFFERDQRHYLAAMTTYLDLAERPPPANLEILDLEDEIIGTARRRYYILSSMLLPALTKVAVKEAEATAIIDLARTALQVEQFRLEHNRLPTDLSELVPKHLEAVPPDPFDGEPLRYRTLDRGYQLYSIGRDRQDDGGVEPPRDRRSGDTNAVDLTLTVER